MEVIRPTAFSKPTVDQITGMSLVELEQMSERDINLLAVQAEATVHMLQLVMRIRTSKATINA